MQRLREDDDDDEQDESQYLQMSSRFSTPVVHRSTSVLEAEVVKEDESRSIIPGIFATILYLVVGTSLPLYNKYVLGSPAATGGFQFPLTLTVLQLAACAVLTLLLSIGRNVWPRTQAGGPHVLYQLRQRQTLLLLVPALFFAGNIALSNVGLFMVNVTAHLVLRNSELVWVVLAALVFRRERPSLWAALCCVAVVAGVVLMSLFLTQEGAVANPVAPLAVNLASAIASALQFVSLRVIVTHLRATNPYLSVVEVSCVKLAAAALLVLLPALLLERDGWAQLGRAPPALAGLLAGGVGITLLYQGVVVALAFLVSATTAGVIAQAKLCVILGAVLLHSMPANAYVVSGTVLVGLGCLMYAGTLLLLRYRARERHVREKPINTDV